MLDSYLWFVQLHHIPLVILFPPSSSVQSAMTATEIKLLCNFLLYDACFLIGYETYTGYANLSCQPLLFCIHFTFYYMKFVWNVYRDELPWRCDRDVLLTSYNVTWFQSFKLSFTRREVTVSPDPRVVCLVKQFISFPRVLCTVSSSGRC